jgi:hypothetical protein
MVRNAISIDVERSTSHSEYCTMDVPFESYVSQGVADLQLPALDKTQFFGAVQHIADAA